MNQKAMEIQTLVIVAIAVVLLLVLLAFTLALITGGNIFSGPENICEQTGGFISGCTP